MSYFDLTNILSLLLLLAGGCFGIGIYFGAPYLPTLSKHVKAALDLLDLEPGQTMLELGCGDGKVVLAAARRGWRVVGYEVNPIMVAVAWLRTRRYHRQVTIVWGNFFTKPLPPAEGIFCFIMPRFMPAIHQKILASKFHPVKVASFAFAITDITPVKKKDGVFLYKL